MPMSLCGRRSYAVQTINTALGAKADFFVLFPTPCLAFFLPQWSPLGLLPKQSCWHLTRTTRCILETPCEDRVLAGLQERWSAWPERPWLPRPHLLSSCLSTHIQSHALNRVIANTCSPSRAHSQTSSSICRANFLCTPILMIL